MKALGKTSKGMTGILKNFKNNWVSITATVGIFGVAMSKVVKKGSELQEVRDKFDVTFKGIDEAAAEATDNLIENFGLSKTAALDLLSSTGDLLNGLGFTKDSALDLSQSVQELSVDLSSFHNLQGGASRASEIITKALLGERDALVSLGVKISEDDLKRRAQMEGIKLVNGALDKESKAMLTLKMITEQSKNAVGNFALTQESFANQSRIMGAALEDAMASVGEAILPVITPVVKAIGKLFQAFTKLPTPVKIAGVAIAGAFGIAIVAAKLFNTTIKANPFIFVASLAILATTLIIANWDKVKAFFQEMWSKLKFWADVAWSGIKVGALTIVDIMIEAASWAFKP